MNAQNWRETVHKGVVVAKPVYAAQIALYQAYMDARRSRHRRQPGCCSPRSTRTPPNSTMSSCRSTPALAQRMSDRGVRILQATDAGELLPRIATTRDFHECRMCPWADRCWGLPA